MQHGDALILLATDILTQEVRGLKGGTYATVEEALILLSYAGSTIIDANIITITIIISITIQLRQR